MRLCISSKTKLMSGSHVTPFTLFFVYIEIFLFCSCLRRDFRRLETQNMSEYRRCYTPSKYGELLLSFIRSTWVQATIPASVSLL